MSRSLLPYLPPVVGEVVEVYQKAGIPTAKIALRMCQIEVPLALLDDLHLGDRILLEADLDVKRLESPYASRVPPERTPEEEW